MKKIREIVSPLFAIILAWSFPVVFLYARNAEEVSVAETISPIGVFLLCGAAAGLVGLLIFRRWQTAALFSALLGCVLCNYTYLLNAAQSITLTARYWHVMYVALILVFALCRLIKKLDIVVYWSLNPTAYRL